MVSPDVERGETPRADRDLFEDLEAIAAMRRHYDWKRDLVAPCLGGRVLEVGCGTGLMLERLAGRERLMGIDRNPLCLARARARLAARPEIELRQVDVLDAGVLALASERFSGVLFANSLELIEDDARALRHAAGLLAAGGSVAILTWAQGTPPPILQPTYGLRGYRPNVLADLLEGAGFREIRIRWMNLLGVLGWLLDRPHLTRRPLMGAEAFARRDRCIPLARLVDRVTGPPWGRLLFATGVRPGVAALSREVSGR